MAQKRGQDPARRRWTRAGYDFPAPRRDQERGRRLFQLVAMEVFWCENCGGRHPLAEHTRCRTEYVTKS